MAVIIRLRLFFVFMGPPYLDMVEISMGPKPTPVLMVARVL
jgi:hypothetical protein